jgi:hypothetical protein
MITPVGIEVYLCPAADRIYGLIDPTGGYFDAAGDFDRLLPTDHVAFPILGKVDPYGFHQLDSNSMPGLLNEIDHLLPGPRPRLEWRGLMRLRTRAVYCMENADSSMCFVGD